MRTSVLLVVVLAGVARADRPSHGSAGGGGSILLTGYRDDRFRFDLAVDVKPRSRVGMLAAWRGFDAEHRGIVMAGLVYEAAASRPWIVLDLHAEVGLDIDRVAPALGGGIRTTLTIVGPLGLALDSGAYVVIDGIEDTRLQLQSNALVVARW
jgi:hypothetical protein